MSVHIIVTKYADGLTSIELHDDLATALDRGSELGKRTGATVYLQSQQQQPCGRYDLLPNTCVYDQDGGTHDTGSIWL